MYTAKPINWEEIKTIPVDYYWIHNGERHHKFDYRKSKLKDKLETFDPELSEVQNCLLNGLEQIFDCGKIKYQYKGQIKNVTKKR